MEIPVSWILTTFISLAGVIATMASIIYKSLSARLEVQDKIIEGMRNDIDRMSKGCGIDTCHWRNR